MGKNAVSQPVLDIVLPKKAGTIVIAGVDPGSKGAVAFISKIPGALTKNLDVYDMPYVDGHLDYRAYQAILRKHSPTAVYVESVWARSARAPDNKGKGMGIATASKFMENVGALKGISACEVDDCHLVTPVSWKRRFNLLKTQKRDSCALAAALWPNHASLFKRISIDDGRAESVLIATFGAERQGLIKLVSA